MLSSVCVHSADVIQEIQKKKGEKVKAYLLSERLTDGL